MYTIKSKSREIYTILPYDDITIIIIIIILATIIIIIKIFFSHPRKTFFLCPKKRTKLHWGEGGVSDKKEAKCDIHRYAPFLRQVNKSTYFGMKINFEEFFSRECHCLLLEVFLLFQRLFCHFCHENSNSPGGKVQECS